MSALPLAHAGHWLINLLYIVPLLIVVAMLGISTLRDRRAAADEAVAPGPPPEGGAGESPA